MDNRIGDDGFDGRSKCRDDTSVGADTASVSTGDSDESSLSPSSSPGVLDLPGSANDTDSEDSVVDGGSAVVEHSGPVGAPVGGVNSDGDGGGVQLVGNAGASGVAVESGDLVSTTLGLASLVFSNIGVSSSSGDTVGLDVGQGGMGPSTVAALVALRSRAVNELLLRQVDVLSLEEEGGLEDTDGRESPAGAAGCLVLDGGDLALGGPVNVSNNLELVVALGDSDQGHGVEESGGELLSGVDGELVDSHLVGLAGIGVVLVDLDEVLLEDESPVCFLLRGPVGSVLSLPLTEGVNLALVGRVVHGQDGNRDQRGDQKLFAHLFLYIR
jgi:hypothetical protein